MAIKTRTSVFSGKSTNLSSRKKNVDDKNCAALKTLTKLLNGEGLKFIEADNTQQAAEMAANGQSRFCITNQTGLEKYQLAAVKELKKMIVCWIPFVYTGR